MEVLFFEYFYESWKAWLALFCLPLYWRVGKVEVGGEALLGYIERLLLNIYNRPTVFKLLLKG